MAKPCTPHPLAQRVQLFEIKTANVKAFLLDGRRPFSFLGKKMGGCITRHKCRDPLRTRAEKGVFLWNMQ